MPTDAVRPPVGPPAELLTAVLGHWTQVADRTRTVGHVLEVRDAAGERWVAKTTGSRAAFRAELRAYRRWVPHFADQAPALRAADEESRTLVLQWLPGVTGRTWRARDHHDAGRLLARIHQAGSDPRRAAPGVAERSERKLALALRLAPPGAVRTEHRAFAEAAVHELRTRFDDLEPVACHGDFGAHNWVRHDGGLKVIDFAESGPGAAVVDFARLYLGQWWRTPYLPRAFFAGYGRPITSHELEAVRLHLPTVALNLLSHAARYDRPQMLRVATSRLDALIAGVDPTRPHRGLVRRLRTQVRRHVRA